MTSQLLNTLFVQTQEAHISLEDDNVRVWNDAGTILKVPLHHLGAICSFGIVFITMPLLMRCADPPCRSSCDAQTRVVASFSST